MSFEVSSQHFGALLGGCVDGHYGRSVGNLHEILEVTPQRLNRVGFKVSESVGLGHLSQREMPLHHKVLLKLGLIGCRRYEAEYSSAAVAHYNHLESRRYAVDRQCAYVILSTHVTGNQHRNAVVNCRRTYRSRCASVNSAYTPVAVAAANVTRRKQLSVTYRGAVGKL